MAKNDEEIEMKPTAKKNMFIGLTVLVSLFLLYWGIEYLKGANMFKPANYYYATFEKIDGLNVSSPVTVNGFQVGHIREMKYDYAHNNIVVEISLDKQMKVPMGSTVSLSSSFLGTAEIHLNLSDQKNYYRVGDMIQVRPLEAGLMTKVRQDIMPSVSNMLPKVDSILGNVNTVVANPGLEASISRVNQITIELEKSSRQLSALMARLNQSVPGVVGHADGVLGNVNALAVELQNTSRNLSEMSSMLKTLPVDSTVSRINATLANLQQLSVQLNSKDSSLGKLTSDQQLYDNACEAVAALQALLEDIKRNPKRYVTFKLL